MKRALKGPNRCGVKPRAFATNYILSLKAKFTRFSDVFHNHYNLFQSSINDNEKFHKPGGGKLAQKVFDSQK
jgi:hypothetical protein